MEVLSQAHPAARGLCSGMCGWLASTFIARLNLGVCCRGLSAGGIESLCMGSRKTHCVGIGSRMLWYSALARCLLIYSLVQSCWGSPPLALELLIFNINVKWEEVEKWPVVINTCCSYRGPRISSQHPQEGSQEPATPVPRDLCLLLTL